MIGLCTQIEFYFGDANLRNDKFLQQKISEHEEGCEWSTSYKRPNPWK